MGSPKQIQASQVNGSRSHGPVTPEGKRNSSGHNFRHGLLAQTVVLETESESRFQAMLEDHMRKHQPSSATETALVEMIVVARWRLLRVWGLQKLAMDRDIALQDPSIGPPSIRAMNAMQGSPDGPSKPDVLHRYEITFDRQIKSAVARLLQLQSKRGKTITEPYFPGYPSGQTWKTEEELAASQTEKSKSPGTV